MDFVRRTGAFVPWVKGVAVEARGANEVGILSEARTVLEFARYTAAMATLAAVDSRMAAAMLTSVQFRASNRAIAYAGATSSPVVVVIGR